MLELLFRYPWLLIVTIALLIPILGIVFGTVTHYLSTIRQAEIEAGLKQDMLQRGMSAEEIKIVIEASPRNAREQRRLEHQKSFFTD